METDDVYRRLLTAASPMPFGSDPFRDERSTDQVLRSFPQSPMPFGSDPFRDSTPLNMLDDRNANVI